MKDKELLELLSRNIDFIKQADSKAAYVSTVLFIVIGFLVSKASLFIDDMWALACLVLLLVCATLIMLLIFKSIFPTVSNSLSKDSSIYFGSIASKTLTQFKKRAHAMKARDYRSELLTQVYVTSKITESKMTDVKRSIFWMMVYLILAGIATLVVKYY